MRIRKTLLTDVGDPDAGARTPATFLQRVGKVTPLIIVASLLTLLACWLELTALVSRSDSALGSAPTGHLGWLGFIAVAGVEFLIARIMAENRENRPVYFMLSTVCTAALAWIIFWIYIVSA